MIDNAINAGHASIAALHSGAMFMRAMLIAPQPRP